jgi:phosphate starvation-inducible PhoH-like protein
MIINYMNIFQAISYTLFFLCLNNCCLLLTCKYVKRLDLTMRKKQNKTTDTFIYMPKSVNQQNYVEHLNDKNTDLIIAVGPAGTGKTLFACLKAISQLKNGEIRKLVVTRPVVTVEEEIGFLPGNINKKMDPWTRPIFDLFLEFFSKAEVDNFIFNNVIEISPLAFMRGRTFKNSFIIADEMQNSSPNQMKMLTTRIGVNSKMVITGDLNQSDIPSKNGLKDLIEKIDNYNIKNNDELSSIKVVNLEKEDIERSEIVKNIINIYDYDDKNVSVKKNTNNVNSITMTDVTNITNKDIINNNSIATDTNTTTVASKNTSNSKISSSTKIKNNYKIHDNDAALIPKHHMIKNTDIFFENIQF